MQSILWCAWPPSGRSSTLEIVCGSNIDDIWGIPRLLLIFYILENLIVVFYFKFCFEGRVQCFRSPPKKIH